MNLGELKQQIATRLNRFDLLTAVPPSTIPIIPAMVSDRILFFQRSLYSPSQTTDYSIVCIPGLNQYPLNVYPALVNVQSITNIRLLLNNIWIQLRWEPFYSQFLEVDVINPPLQTLPSRWHVRGQMLRIFAAPNQPYPLELTCSAAPPEPATDIDSNWWTLSAATLLIEACCAEICRTTLNDDARSTQHEYAAQRENRSLQDYTRRLRGPLRMRPYR